MVLALQSNRRALLRAMVERVPGWSERRRGRPSARYALLEGPGGVTLLDGGSPLSPPTARVAALERFRAAAQLLVAELSPQRVFVHAGVVGWRGRAVVIPGRSHSGKTTLVRALLERGASYLSDEYALIDRQGRVHPYLRPLQIRTGGRLLRRSPQALGATVENRALSIGAVIMAGYREGADWKPTMASPGQAILELFANTVSAQRDPRRALSWLARGVGAWGVLLSGARGDAGDAAARLCALLDAGSGR